MDGDIILIFCFTPDNHFFFPNSLPVNAPPIYCEWFHGTPGLSNIFKSLPRDPVHGGLERRGGLA